MKEYSISKLFENLKNKQLSKEDAIKELKRIKFLESKKVKSENIQKEVDESPDELDSNQTNQITELLMQSLVRIVCKLLKIHDSNEIQSTVRLNEYGFESITLAQFAQEINDEFTLELTPTLFFEYDTLEIIVDHLRDKYREDFLRKFHIKAKEKPLKEEIQAAQKPEFDSFKPSEREFSDSTSTHVALEETKSGEPELEAIAIVGLSGCFPEAKDLDSFWENLYNEVDLVREIPKSRWNWEDYTKGHKSEENKTDIKWGSFLNHLDEFDPLFFGISSQEAEIMDPHHRLIMTYVWKAIEDAGYSASSLAGSRTALLIGTAASGYGHVISKSGMETEGYSATSLTSSIGPNRMSFYLDWRGPSEPFETGCASSLIALHRAVTAIRSGECSQALVGAVNTLLSPEAYVSLSKSGMLSADGRCKTFSEQANGYVRGEGVGMLMLKKLSDAERDGDHIYGLVLGSSVNHGGRASSLTSPNPKAQAELLMTAYRQSGVDPSSVGYIEVNGLGTQLGDSIEVDGLISAFSELYKEKGLSLPDMPHCGLGNAKYITGHLEMAAGISGVIKVLLQMRNKKLIKGSYSKELNPYIRLKGSPFYLVDETKDWESIEDDLGNELPRRAGVSTFSFGGVNAHVVLEEYVPNNLQRSRKMPEQPYLFVFSARDESRLREQAVQFKLFIEKGSVAQDELSDMAYTLQIGREAMEERLAFTASSLQEVKDNLQAYLDGNTESSGIYLGRVQKTNEAVLLFSSDDDIKQALDNWIEKGKIHKLLSWWLKGVEIDWQKLHRSFKPQRISLPTYPFAREKYWAKGISSPSHSSVLSEK